MSPSGKPKLNVHGKETADKFRAGNITGAAYRESNSLWKTDDNRVAGSYSNPVGGSEQVKSVEDERIVNMGNSQHHQSNGPQLCINAFKGESGTYEKQECIQRENSTDSYHSNASQHTITGHELRENVWLHKSDSRNAEGNQSPSGQVCQNAFTSSRLSSHHASRNCGVNIQHVDNINIICIYRSYANRSLKDHAVMS